jgi:5'-deoxynucleotidase YfbR-like HD superfamily hydrolase
LPQVVTTAIKHADRVAAYYEATVLAGFGIDEARRFFGEPRGLPAVLEQRLTTLTPLASAEAQDAFLTRFNALFAK